VLNTDITDKTLELAKASLENPIGSDDPLAKAITQSSSPTTGLTAYDLAPTAYTLYPVLTPLRNAIPRDGDGEGTQANWKAVTAINVNAMDVGVSEGNRGGIASIQVTDYNAVYRGIGLESYTTYEAQRAARGLADARAVDTTALLRSLMIGEEKVILGGNNSLALGTTPTPTLVANTTGGTLAAATYSVICVALTHAGLLTASVANGIRGSVSRTNADSSTDTYGGGSAAKSANATVTTTGATGSISASVAAVSGACGYAWFWGAAGSEVLGAISTINSTVIAATAAGTQTAASLSGDNSKNSLVFDGILTQVYKTGVGYMSAQPTGTAGTGTPLTSDGAGGINEIDTALKWFWDNFRVSPSAIWVNSQEQMNITKKILAGNANAAQRFVLNVEQGNIKGGDLVRSYLNKFAMDGAQEIPIKLHPNMPAGTILFDTDVLNYSLADVPGVKRIRCRADYHQIDWAQRSRKYEYGIYADEVLQIFAPFAFGVISNIANG
jgi:hypothetical protein